MSSFLWSVFILVLVGIAATAWCLMMQAMRERDEATSELTELENDIIKARDLEIELRKQIVRIEFENKTRDE